MRADPTPTITPGYVPNTLGGPPMTPTPTTSTSPGATHASTTTPGGPLPVTGNSSLFWLLGGTAVVCGIILLLVWRASRRRPAPGE